ncbi:hypothetical protein FOCC_FOCC003408 [Frankliniella occidentalis]|nr:hypothetical protein FOCC_FOCC003408 [Frankliniella occidentalis]
MAQLLHDERPRGGRRRGGPASHSNTARARVRGHVPAVLPLRRGHHLRGHVPHPYRTTARGRRPHGLGIRRRGSRAATWSIAVHDARCAPGRPALPTGPGRARPPPRRHQRQARPAHGAPAAVHRLAAAAPGNQFGRRARGVGGGDRPERDGRGHPAKGSPGAAPPPGPPPVIEVREGVPPPTPSAPGSGVLLTSPTAVRARDGSPTTTVRVTIPSSAASSPRTSPRVLRLSVPASPAATHPATTPPASPDRFIVRILPATPLPPASP